MAIPMEKGGAARELTLFFAFAYLLGAFCVLLIVLGLITYCSEIILVSLP
jgi:hypothetical protein